MKPRTFIICASVTVCGLTVAGVVLQARQLGVLRGEGQRFRQELQRSRDEQVSPVSADTKPIVSSPSAELLRLRNQVSQLSMRQRELAGVETENARLRAQVEMALTNATTKVAPQGFIRKANARNLGYATPEATLETFFWAMQNRDFGRLVESCTPEVAAKFKRDLERGGKSEKEFIDIIDRIGGFYIVERTVVREDFVELTVVMLRGNDAKSSPMQFQRINGEWKSESR